MLLNILGLIAGFFLLIKAADYMVEGASSVAKKYGISPLAIGLTVVAFGTSAPELVVNVLSASQGSAPLAVGNVMGSNLANIFLILGVASFIKPLRVQLTTVWKEIPFMLLAAVMVLTMAADVFLDGGSGNVLSATNGLSLLGFFVIFMFYSYSISKVGGEKGEIKSRKTWISTLMILGGLVGLVVGGQLIVGNAVSIARMIGVGEGLIGLTIVAIGTSLPELATAIAAVRKDRVDLAIGNVVGSNIFNIFFVLGITAVVAPLPFSGANLIDAVAVIIASVVLFSALFVGERHTLARRDGMAFLVFYVAYIAYSIAIYTCLQPFCVA